MKTTMTWLLGLAMVLLSGHVLANAKVFSMTGTVSAATGAAPAQPVKVGDTIRSGQTAVTGANSTVVLQFPDGQLASLTPNSRMTIEAYQYNEQAKTGNVLLALVSGGMRAITGFIGRSTPDKVSYKAAAATIGIRGTDTTIAIAGTQVSVIVSGGMISFSVGGGAPVQIAAGQGTVVRDASGAITSITITSVAAVVATLAQTNPALASAVNSALSTTTSTSLQGASTPNTGTVSTTTTTTGTTTTTTSTITVPPNPPSN